MILPGIKEIRKCNKWFYNDLIFPHNENGERASKVLNLFSPVLKTYIGNNFNVILNSVDFKNKGEYRLTVTEVQIIIDYCDYEGLRNAVATLSGLEEQGKIKCAVISDYPDNEFRSCLLDLARGYVEIAELKEHLLRLSKLKFNVVHLHLMDRQSYILESNVVPNPDNYRQYKREELRGIVEFCNLLSLDAIPEIEFPAHAVNLLKAVPQLACEIIDIEKALKDIESLENPRKEFYIDKEKLVSSWTVCIGKESTYKIYEDIIDEIIDIFDSEYIHIGGDEIAFNRLGAFPHWDNCHECKKLMEKYDSDLLSIYHHGIRRINDIVKSKGKKTIKWNESSECIHSVDLPTDIIFEYWLSDSANESQSHIDRFIEMGYTLINAQYQYTYADLQEYMNAEKIKIWTPSKNEAQKNSIIAGEMCAWELGNKEYSYYEYTLPICMVLFSDRVWNSNTVQYTEEYTKAVFSSVIGENSIVFNPLGIFEDIIPPRKLNVLEILDLNNFDTQEISHNISKLKEINEKNCYGRIALNNFIKYLEKLYFEMENN